jgi:hypothetical protein
MCYVHVLSACKLWKTFPRRGKNSVKEVAHILRIEGSVSASSASSATIELTRLGS